jgi:hypothetical protein
MASFPTAEPLAATELVPGAPAETPTPTGMDGLIERLAPLGERFGIPRADIDAMVEPWRWRAVWGATMAAMAASAAMRPWVYSRGEITSDVSYHLKWVLLIIFMVMGGMAGDLYGHRRLLIASLTGVTVSCLLAMLSTSSVGIYTAMSLVAALCGAVALPLTLAVLRTSLQQQVMGIGVVLYMSGYCVGMVLPYLGSALGWWLGPAYSMVPLVLAAAVALDSVSAYSPVDGPVTVRRGDLVAAALLVLAMGCMALGVQHASAEDTSAAVSLAWFVAGMAGLVAFAWWQGRLPTPALDLRCFRQHWFVAGLLAGGVVSFSLQISWRAALLLLITLIGQVTLQEVLRIVVFGLIGAGAGMGASALLSSRVNGGHLMASGITAMSVGMFGVGLIVWRDVHIMWLILPVALVSGGLVLGNLLRTLVIVAGVPLRSAGSAAGLLNGVGFLGGLFAPLVFRPLVTEVTTDQVTSALGAHGLAPEQIASGSASFTATWTELLRQLTQAEADVLRSVAVGFQTAMRDSLLLLTLFVGILLAVAAATIWIAWRGQDTPLWPPKSAETIAPAPEGEPAPEPA